MSSDKYFHIFDDDGQSMRSQEDVEAFYSGRMTAEFDQTLAHRETCFHLGPGDCLHSPVNSPHWVQNGPSICIALSVLLYLPENADGAHAFQANWLWRRLGFRPSPIVRNDHSAVGRRGWLFRTLARKRPMDKRDVIASGRAGLVAPLRPVKWLLGLQRRRATAG